MDLRSTTFEHLTGDKIAAWAPFQRSERHLASTFFRAALVETVLAVRNNIVAIFEGALLELISDIDPLFTLLNRFRYALRAGRQSDLVRYFQQ